MTPYRPNLGFGQQQQFQRDFAPAQRFIRHSMGPSSSYQQQQSGGFFSNRPQSYSRPPYQQHQNDYGGPRQNSRPRMPPHQQRPYNNYNNYNNNYYNQRRDANEDGSWTLKKRHFLYLSFVIVCFVTTV